MKTSVLEHVPDSAVAGWRIVNWCEAISIARPTFYTLVNRPKTVKIGRRTIVIESPQAYLQRIADTSLEAA